ncbi:hypothetical protein PP935_gp211 [Rhizobium phage RHph_N34]|uniref:Uncharacterized protein n=1 Tax=Rhizobium phage RHph_N34 TaxID=2509586 RepID=A0A7S5UYX3_9CAUD|nr:hypothetical protein PP935_gp211 [Rhizobium phage RHph_N34]QIG73986.1 hypothetical protein EVC06_211 [Rhizobium phage RHph_N34]
MAVYRVDVIGSKGYSLFFGSLNDVWDAIESTWKDVPSYERPVIRRHAKDSLHYWIADQYGQKFADVVYICDNLCSGKTDLKLRPTIGV